jgi:hypothetical protein
MTTEHDPRTRTVLSWLRDDAHENAERVLLRALDEVDTTPQRRSQWPAWRNVRMNKLAMTATAAGLLLVAVVGSNLLPGLASLRPGATPSPSSGDASLPVGPHLMDPQGEHGEDRVMVTIPAPGWFAPDAGSLTKDLGGGDRVTVAVVPGDYYTMPPNTCDWRVPFDQRENFMPTTADEFVAYLAGQTYDAPDGSRTRAFSAPDDVTIAWEHGQRIVQAVRAYPDSDPSACDEQRFCSVLDRDNVECLLSHREPGALDTLWVVEPGLGNRRIYFLVVAATGSPSAGLREEMNTLVSSMTFHVD